jgi:metallophosphoesterase superfamily enzyme
VGEVAGHLHPSASLTVRGRRLTRRCFVADGTRLLLPAFGSYTGGLDVLDPAIASLFADGFHATLLGEHRVHALPHHRLERRDGSDDRRRRPGGHWGLG